MSCRIETVGAASWQFCPDELQAIAYRLRALVQARIVDEITRLPARIREVSTPDRRLALHVVPRIADDGIVGLAGRPGALFPDLALNPVQVPMHVSADGYLPLDFNDTLGPIGGFPDAFAAIEHGDVFMHRIGVGFSGRVVKRGTPANTPLAGATLEIDGIWSTYPPPNVMPAAVIEPPRLVALNPPGFYANRPAAVLSHCTLVENLPETKRLLLPAPPHTRRLRLNNRHALIAGMPLLIDPLDIGRREVIGIHAIDTGFSDDQPAWIELDYPLKHLHRQSVQVIPANVPVTSDPRILARPALAGDAVAFTTASAPWPDFSLIQVDDGISPLEYHWITRYATVADADGYFQLPPISRLALFRLRTSHATEPLPLQMTIEPDYGRAIQNLSVAFE